MLALHDAGSHMAKLISHMRLRTVVNNQVTTTKGGEINISGPVLVYRNAS